MLASSLSSGEGGGRGLSDAKSRFSESRDKLVYLCRALAISQQKEYRSRYSEFLVRELERSVSALFLMQSYNLKIPMSIPYGTRKKAL
jgi:hypothetical protein